MRRLLTALAACALLACSDDGNDPAPGTEVRGVRAVNATLDTLDVLFDGVPLRTGVVVGEVVPSLRMPPPARTWSPSAAPAATRPMWT